VSATGVLESDMSMIGWLVLGAICGWIAGLLVGDGADRLGLAGHVLVGVVGAMTGGILASALFGADPVDGTVDPFPIATAVIGAILVVAAADAMLGSTRSGRGRA
jgi:uncharacterized membrane protein YeaQ/YmgE (transglycosylase-associated protein family)